MNEHFSAAECSETFERLRDVAINGGLRVLTQKDCAIAVTEIGRLHDRIAASESDLQAALDTVHAWEGTTCGGDCLAAPCGSCDGTGRTVGKGEWLEAQVAELKDDLAALEDQLAQARAERDTAREELRNLGDRYEERVRERDEARAERDHWMRLWLKPEPDAARKEGT